MPRSFEEVRVLTLDDVPQVIRLLQTSEYIYQRFTLEELSIILSHYPGLGIFNGPSLRAFLLSQTIHAPSAWIAGFCVSWTESKSYQKLLSTLLVHLAPLLIARGVHYLHYSGNDIERDWCTSRVLSNF